MDWANSTLEFSLNIHEYQSAGAGADNRFVLSQIYSVKKTNKLKHSPFSLMNEGKVRERKNTERDRHTTGKLI